MGQSAWLEDKSGRMDLAEVVNRSEDFTPFKGALTKGYSTSTFWLRLRIRPSPEKKLILRIRPVYLDHIELFEHSALERSVHGLTPRLSGDHHPKKNADYRSLNHGFTIDGSESPREIYLRLQTTSSLLTYAEVLTVDEAASADHVQELIYGVYLGLLAAFMVWALLHWFESPRKS